LSSRVPQTIENWFQLGTWIGKGIVEYHLRQEDSVSVNLMLA
jgi:hypothetical protein